MTAFELRIIAVLAMIVDHVGMVFYPGVVWWRVVGRVAFPIFAWLVANGYRNSKNIRGYAQRLGILALISQLPYYLIQNEVEPGFWGLNIFVTLLVGLGAIAGWERLGKVWGWLWIVGLAVGGELIGAEYGAYGVLLVVGWHLVYGRVLYMGAMLATMIGAFYWKEFMLGYFVKLYAMAVVPLIGSYDGKEGQRRFKWWFYVFYPSHLTVLFLIKKLG
jgi:hypothetical protein